LWLAHYNDQDLGPYDEVIFCMGIRHVSEKNITIKCDDPELCLVEAMNAKEEYCHLLYLNEDLPIAYGKEILGTNKKKMNNSKISFQPKSPGSNEVNITYVFPNVLTGSFDLDLSPVSGLLLFPRLVSELGFKTTFNNLWDTVNEHTNEFRVRFSRGFTTIINSDKFFTEVRFSVKAKEAAIIPWNSTYHKLNILLPEITKFDLEPAAIFQLNNAKGVVFPPTVGDQSIGLRS